MSEHKLFSPSKSSMWIACPGSMSFPENQNPEGGSSSYADDGSATHHWGAVALRNEEIQLGDEIEINGATYTLDEERLTRVIAYADDVQRRSLGGYLHVERFVSLGDLLGEGQGGTPDVAICIPDKKLGIIEDLKDGSGERVYASTLIQPATDTTPEIREPNSQLALYALAWLPLWDLFCEIEEITLVIFQPKLNVIDEFTLSRVNLLQFARKAAFAVELARQAMVHGPTSLFTSGHLHAGVKQCRWCRVAVNCPELARVTEEETRMDFDDETSQPANPIVYPNVDLGRLYARVPLVEIWCKAVKAELSKRVLDGEAIMGPDSKPYKFVEGEEGKRGWDKEQLEAAEAAVLGQLGPDAYSKPALLTAPAVEKALIKKFKGKKKIEQLWLDVFAPLIKRPRGQPILTVGSDPRPAFTGSGKASDFEDEQEDLSA